MSDESEDDNAPDDEIEVVQPEDNEPQAYAADADGFDELHDAYTANLRRIDRLPELDMRVAALDEALREHTAEEAAWWLDQLMRGALWGRSPEIDAMMACSMWLIRARLDDDYDLIKNIFTAAHADDRKAVIAILRDPPPHKALPAGKRLKEPDLQIDRDVSVGEKRQLARGNNRQMIERLLLDPNPLVIEQLLENPSVRQQDVLMVSTKRPNTPEILLKVALHRRWFNRREIRYSVVMNPYNGTGLSLKLLPTLGIQKLRKVRNSTTLHPTILEAAEMLVELREERTAPWRV
jgi:hypothetical protein